MPGISGSGAPVDVMQGYRNRDRQALLYGLGAVLAWSTVATAFKLTLRELDVLQQSQQPVPAV